MAMVVNTNMASINAQRNLGASNSKLAKSLERLSSGLRINKASDDAAGIAIATKFSSQVRGLNQAVRNANNAITLTQTAEGGLNTVTNILQRLRELAVQSSSDDNTQSDRDNLANEGSNLTSELSRMITTTEYNTMTLLDGSFTDKSFQVGANYGQKISFTIGDARAKTLGGRAELDTDIADGVVNAVDAGFGQSEVKINGYGVAATSATDDQYSVLDISSGQMGILVSGGVAVFTINDEAVTVTLSAAETGASVATAITDAIVNADLTNVTARVVGTGGYVIEATNGTDLNLNFSTDMVGSATAIASLGMADASDMFGLSGAATVTVNNANGQSSALAKAVTINAIKTDSGVAATAEANVVTGTTAITARTIDSGDLYINGVNIGSVTVTASDGTGALVSAINAQTGNTGVSADTDADGQLVLTATDGRNITVTATEQADETALFGAAFGTAYFTNSSAVFRSTIQLNADSAFDITGSVGDLYDGGTTATENMTKTTDTSQSVASSTSTYNAASLSIGTQSSAQSAILTIDAALADVNGIRAEIGAIQNRLEFTVSNLEIASENMSSSQSRIMDADFASETAIFTRNQIMVQAATSILAQANTLPQMALKLLG